MHSSSLSESGVLKETGIDSTMDIEEGKKDADSTKKSNDTAARFYKLAICFTGLQVSYVLWGVIQEHIMTHEYKLGKFRSSTFLVFANRFLALIFALVIVVARKVLYKQSLKNVPFYYYAPSSLSNTISSWAQYEALKYVSFPTQVLSKSCKIIPVMLVGILLNNVSYPLLEYIEAVLISLGVVMFTWSDRAPGAGHGGAHAETTDTALGMSLLALYLFCDSFTSQWQSRVFKQLSIDQYQMMLGVSIWSMLMTGVTLMHSGDFFSSLGFILADSSAFYHMTLLSLASATGQLFIFYTIKELGPVIFTIIMTTRQVFSLFISCLLFSHSLSISGWLSSLLVFAIVFNRIYRKGSD